MKGPRLIEFSNQVLMKEYERLCTDIRSLESANEKILGLGFALIGLGATAGIYQQVEPIFFVLPVAVVGVIAYASVTYLCIYAMGGYKRFIEDLINDRSGENVLLWERLVRTRERNSVNGHVLRTIYGIIATSIFAVSIYRISSEYGMYVALGMAALLLILTCALAVGFRQMMTIFDRTYAEAKQLRDDRESTSQKRGAAKS